MAGAQKAVGLIGVGNMGRNIAQNLYDNGYSLVLYNRTPEGYLPFTGKPDISIAKNLSDLARKVSAKPENAIVWLMVPPGKETNKTVSELSVLLRTGDIVIDASNSEYTDSISNYRRMKQNGIHYIDVGCAGGPNNLLTGVALMAGGDREAYDKAEEVLKAVAMGEQYGYVGNPGTGHMAKLTHNMIFYGMFPIISEAVESLIVTSGKEFKGSINIAEILRLYGTAPPITNGIYEAIGQAIQKGLPEDAPEVKLSQMVRFGIENAKKNGLQLDVLSGVLNAYGRMSRGTRVIYHSAKKILTGH